MLDHLLSLADDWDEPSAFLARIEAIAWSGRDVTVRVRPEDGFDPQRRLGVWEVTCQDVQGVSVTDPSGEIRALGDESPIVRQFVDSVADLTFYGRTADAQRTALRLLAAEQEATGGLLPRLIHPQRAVELLSGGFGQLALGPSFVVAALHRVLVDAGIKATLSAPRPRTEWLNATLRELRGPYFGLKIGRTWFVAADFIEARRE